MRSLRPRTALFFALCGLAAGTTAVAAPPALEVRFYPDRELRIHESNAQRGVWSALLQNASVVNRGEVPVTLETITIELRAVDELAQSHPLAGETLAAIAARSGKLAASGMIEMFAFQFRPERLLAGGKAVGSTTLAPGEALLLGHRAFSVQGTAIDRLRIEVDARDASGQPVEGRGELPIRRGPSTNRYLFPLAGNWFVGAGASLHSHHRWVAGEEFALDIARLDTGGRTFRTTGATNADYFAWEAPIRAVADGKVVAVVDRFVDSDEGLKRPDESAETYAQRVQMAQMAQMALFQQGLDAIGGNVVVIEHAHGEFSHSAHLRHGSILVKAGDLVKRGQAIAKLGNTDNSTEPHLHFQVSDGADTLGSAGMPIAFEALEILLADAPRAIQSGDVVDAR